MKKIVLLLVLIFVIRISNGQTFTKITNFPDNTKQLTWVFSTSKDTAYITAFDTKVLYRTIDGGTTWKTDTLSTLDTFDLTDIYFTDKTNGWITGSFKNQSKGGGVLFKTTDAGVSWQNVSSTVPNIASNNLGCIRMNGQNGVIGNFTGDFKRTVTPSYYLTTDGGTTWTAKNFPTFSPFFPAAGSQALRLANNPANNTFQMSVRVHSTYNAIYHSSDNGLTFSEAYTERDYGGNNFGLEIVNTNGTAYWISNTTPKKSVNDGASWSNFSYLPSSSNKMLSGFFKNALEGLIVGENSSIYKTTDGGSSWTELQNINGAPKFRSLFMNSGTFWAVGENSIVYKAVEVVSNTPCVTNKPKVTKAGNTVSINTITGATYRWLNCNSNNAVIAGETSASYTATVNGRYSVEIVRANNCKDTSVCTAITGIGLIENTFATDLKLYPNPTSNKVTIELGNNYSNVAVEITNVLGQVITRKTIETVTHRKINLPINAANGIYFVSIKAKEGFARFRLVKE